MSINRFCLPALLGALAVVAASAPASAQSTVISRHVPPIVQNGRAKLLAPMNGSETLHLTLALPLRNQDQLEALLADLYNPKSPNFHQWLSQPDFEARFGRSKVEIKTLRNWAISKGLTVTLQAENNRLIDVDGSVEAVNAAFNVVETKYHDTYLERDFYAPDREPTTDLPFELLDVEGIENSAPIVKHLKKDPSAGIPALLQAPGIGNSVVSKATKPGSPKPNVYGSGPANSYLPSDMRAAYYGNGNLTGAGQTVGIFSFDGYLPADLQIYYANTGMTTTVPVTNVIANGTGACTATCEDDEQILDIVQVQGMAPGLSGILFYEGTSANTELNKMVTDNLAKTISCSWGGGGFGTSSDTYFMQMATQGQSFLDATGDDGAFFKSNYSAPAFDPYITQVGGTDLYTTGPGGAWSSEISWADSGGGYWLTGMSTSAKYTIPTWQTGAVNSSNLASSLYRNVPDIAAEANFDNPTANNGSFEIGYGGTSYAAPRMAGYIALANQQAVAHGQTTLGFLNPAIYAAGLGSSSASIFHDITVGSNPAYPSTGPTYYAVAGYDLVTGFGSPIGPALINALAGTAIPSFAVPATAQGTMVRGGSLGITLPVTPYNGWSSNIIPTNLSGLPSGWGAVYSGGTGTTGSPLILYFSSPATQAVGTYPVILTVTDANNSALTQNVSLSLVVYKRANGDFTIQQNAAATIAAGASGSTTVLVTPGSGLPDVVNLSVSGVPPGLTAAFFDPTVQPQTPKNALLVLTAAASATPNTYVLTVTGSDAQGIVHTANVPVTITAPASLLVNGGFETGTASPWTFTTVSGSSAVSLLTISSTLPAHLGNYFALMEGGSTAGVDSMTQQTTIPYGYSRASLSLWYWILTGQTGTTAVDTMTVQLIDINNNNAVTTLGTLSNLNASGYWSNLSFDVSKFIGHKVIVQITATQAGTTYTDFLVDDVALTVY